MNNSLPYKRAFFASLLIWCVTAGCEQESSTPDVVKNEKTPPSQTDAVKDSGIPNLPENAVASVNGEVISKQEFDLIANQYESMDPDAFKKMTDSERDALFGRIVDQLITLKVLIQEAKKHNIQIPAELIEQEYEAFKANFPSEDEFLETLRKGKTTPLIWKKGAKEFFTVKRLNEIMADQLTVSDEEVQRYWEENKTALKKDMVRARQILVKTDAEAQIVLSKLRQGSSFETLVGEYSVDMMTKDKGGNLGWILKGTSIEEFDQTVFPLKAKQFSPPIKGRFGYHIVQVLGKKKGTETTLEDHREKIEFHLRNQKWQAQRFQWIDSLKKKATIEMASGITLSQTPIQTVLDKKLPKIGEKAISSMNKFMTSGMNEADLCSAKTYCNMHSKTIKDSIDQNKPILILFATPGYCETGTCSPQLHDVLKMKNRYGDQMDFIHVDIYLDMVTVVEWGMETEPWTIIVDHEGIIRGRLSGMTGGKAIEKEILKVLS